MLSYAGTQTGSSRNGTAVRLTTRQEVRGGIIACWLAPYQHRSAEVREIYAKLLGNDPLTDLAADFVAGREDPLMSSTSGGSEFMTYGPVPRSFLPRSFLPSGSMFRKVVAAASTVPDQDLPLESAAGEYDYRPPDPGPHTPPAFVLTPEKIARKKQQLSELYRWCCQRRLSGFSYISTKPTPTNQGNPA